MAVSRDVELKRLRAEVERLRSDAERYRWLRGDGPLHDERWSRWNLQRWDGRCWHPLQHADLDAAIDAARTEGCAHEWTDMRNQVTTSGEVCLKCGAIRTARTEGERAPDAAQAADRLTLSVRHADPA